MSEKRDRAINCVFCRDLHLTLMFSGLTERSVWEKEGDVWRKVFSYKIIATQELASSFLSRPVASVH